MQGTIQRLIRGKGFGFIVADGQKYFFHHSEVQDMKFKRLSAGDVVEFEPQEEGEGNNPRATDIVLVERKVRPPRKEAGSSREPRGSRDSEPSAPVFPDPAPSSPDSGEASLPDAPADPPRRVETPTEGFPIPQEEECPGDYERPERPEKPGKPEASDDDDDAEFTAGLL